MPDEKIPFARPSDSSAVPGTTAASPASRPKSRTFLWIVVVLVVLLVAFIYWLHHLPSPTAGGGSGRGSGFGPALVSTTAAYQGDIGIYVNGLGSVTPLNLVSVNSRVQGQIVKISYTEGQYVHAGDPLLEIDPGPNQAALTQAEGQLERDAALLENARRDSTRYQDAYASNAIPKQLLDTQESNVRQYEGAVKVDEGVLDNAKVQLAYCYITAPISGRIGLRLVDQGNIIQANGTNLVTIAQLQPISVIFSVAEDYLPQILAQLRQGKELRVDAYDRDMQQKLATGSLETLDNQISPVTGTVQLRAIFTNDDESLFPNQFVNARLLVDTLQNVTLLPNTVIQRNADSAFVYTLSPDPSNQLAATSAASSSTGTNQPPKTQLATLRTITVGVTDGNVSQVQGIDPGTVVIADNFNKLDDGTKVIVRPSAGSSNGSGAGASHHRQQKTSQ